MATHGRVYNFSAGPAVQPEWVLETAAAEMLNYHGSGMSVMEMTHRGPHWEVYSTFDVYLLRLQRCRQS